jgi:hypothetical protein
MEIFMTQVKDGDFVVVMRKTAVKSMKEYMKGWWKELFSYP